nr:MAG TPA: hypothetical protein [Caudoviricetes sp.]
MCSPPHSYSNCWSTYIRIYSSCYICNRSTCSISTTFPLRTLRTFLTRNQRITYE